MEYKPNKTERTKAQLGEAVISLLEELPPERITADAIAARAGMGRATWFRHFSNKTDAVTCALVARWMRWAAQTNADVESPDGLEPFLRQIFNERATISLLYAAGMRQAVVDASATISQALWAQAGHLGYREKFYLYGFVGVIDEWVVRDFADTPEDVARMVRGATASTWNA